MAERKAKRVLEQKLARVKKLGESSSEDEDSAAAWVKKNRKIANEKMQAEKRVRFQVNLILYFLLKTVTCQVLTVSNLSYCF